VSNSEGVKFGLQVVIKNLQCVYLSYILCILTFFIVLVRARGCKACNIYVCFET